MTNESPTTPDADFLAMAQDELARALTLTWRDLSKIIPWGDSFDGVSPAGRDVAVARSYLWADDPGGDILCEVTVNGGESRFDHGVLARARIVNPADTPQTTKPSSRRANRAL